MVHGFSPTPWQIDEADALRLHPPKHGISLVATIDQFGAMVIALKNKIHAIAPELQFWGYEGGNVLAAIAGAGGFIAFYNGLLSVGDALSTICALLSLSRLSIFW